MKIIPIQSSPAVRFARKIARRKAGQSSASSNTCETSLAPKVFTEDELYFDVDSNSGESLEDSEAYSLFFGAQGNGNLQKLYKKILKLKYPYLRTLDIYT